MYGRVCDAQRRLRRVFGILIFSGLVLSASSAYIISENASSITHIDIALLLSGQVFLLILYGVITGDMRSNPTKRLYFTFEPPKFGERNEVEDDTDRAGSEVDCEDSKTRFLSCLTPLRLLTLSTVFAFVFFLVSMYWLL